VCVKKREKTGKGGKRHHPASEKGNEKVAKPSGDITTKQKAFNSGTTGGKPANRLRTNGARNGRQKGRRLSWCQLGKKREGRKGFEGKLLNLCSKRREPGAISKEDRNRSRGLLRKRGPSTKEGGEGKLRSRPVKTKGGTG